MVPGLENGPRKFKTALGGQRQSSSPWSAPPKKTDGDPELVPPKGRQSGEPDAHSLCRCVPVRPQMRRSGAAPEGPPEGPPKANPKATSMTAQEAPETAPRGPQNGPRGLQDAEDGLQDGLQDGSDGPKMPPRRPNMHPRRPKMASRWPKTAQEAPQRPPRRPKRPPRAPPGRPEEAQIIDFPYVGLRTILAFAPFRHSDGPRRPKRPPRSPPTVHGHTCTLTNSMIPVRDRRAGFCSG